MRETRRYAESGDTILIVLSDMAELQRGKLTLSDTLHGRIHFRTEMYGSSYEYRFSVAGVEDGCEVALEMEGPHAKNMIFRAFHLLESLLADPACADHPKRE